MNIRTSLGLVLKERSYVVAWIANGLLLLLSIVLAAIEIRPNDLQVPIRYSAFGITNINRAPWYDEFSLLGLSVLVFVLTSLIGLKLAQVKSVQFATAYLWFMAAIMAIIFFVLLAIFRVIAVVG